jgi:nucleoside phosphorylase
MMDGTKRRADDDPWSFDPKKRKADGNHDDGQGPFFAATSSHFSKDDYTVGWICALPVELGAAMGMLDEIHPALPSSTGDDNIYTLGLMESHGVVIACLPSGVYGTTQAALVASQMNSAFPSIRFRLMVGIGGGVPTEDNDIRLGDVVVSMPTPYHGGVVQYDSGKTIHGGVFQRTGSLNKPPAALLKAVSKLRAEHASRRSRIPDYLSDMVGKNPTRLAKFTHRRQLQDKLFEATYEHIEHEATCERCDSTKLVSRPARPETDPAIHYGTIASSNQVMKHGETRDRLARDLGRILCFEMEAAGLMDHFPCLVVRGICDYADSHKNKQWQEYAAGTAAAFAKELLSVILANRGLHSPESKGESSSLNKTQKKTLMDSLRFDQIDARQMTIKNAHNKTCKWLLQKSEYLDWLDPKKVHDHHGFLWIKGKAAMGKSTLMKFALATARKSMKNAIVVSFFFNARGDALEKSTIGMYRSLLLQLLERLPKLQSVFDCLGLATWNNESYNWTAESLKMLFETAVQGIGETPLMCYIDALDECDDNQIRDMVSFFQSLGEVAVSTHIRLQVFFSSRHYPHITIADGISMELEGQEGHNQDIANYIGSELRIGQSNLATQIRAELQEKSSGVFMWVVLVVDILNKEHDQGQTSRQLQRKLKETPSDLHKLFREIMTRDSDNRDELLLCIQWLLFARKPLKPEELYYAILSGTEPEDLSEWELDETPIDTVKKFVLNSSKGLAEITRSETPTVQFIHESVRDFLLKEKGLSDVWPDLGVNFEGSSHERLKHCCLEYMKMESASTVIDIPLPKASTPEAADLRQSKTRAYPFLEYAVQNVLHHSNAAQAHGCDQRDFVHSFQLADWVKRDNLFERYEVRRHTSDVSFLYILAENNLSSLIEIHPSRRSCFDVEAERYGLPIFAAIATESHDAVQAFTEVRADGQPAWPLLGDLYKQYCQDDDKSTKTGRDFLYPRRNSIPLRVYRQLASQKHDICFAFLYVSKVSEYSGDGYLLELALRHGLGISAKLLLNQDSSKELGNIGVLKNGHSLISLAASGGSQSVVGSLLEKGADLESRDMHGRTPLSIAAASGSTETVRLLLEKGADIESKDKKGCTPLLMAATYGREEIVRLLLEKGADLESRDKDGRTPLSIAAASGSTETVRLLLEKSADLESRDKNGCTPLWRQLMDVRRQ